jgi:hypothetical protein
LAIVSGQKQLTGRYVQEFRFAAAGSRLGEPIRLSDYECIGDIPYNCAGVALADDGTAILAYPRSVGGDDIAIDFVRRSPDGTLSPAQQISGEFWQNVFDGLSIAINRPGDAVVSFTEERGDPFAGLAFVRCPAGMPCVDATYLEGDYPARWRTSMGADAEATVTWSENEWVRDLDIVTRQLTAAH